MSFSNINIGKKVDNYDVSEVFNSYGRVDVVLGEDNEGNIITVSYPNISDDKVSGRILTVDMPMCTDTTLARTAAMRIFNSLMSKDPTAFQYQPQMTNGAIVDPSIEFGDSIDVNGVHSGFHVRTTIFGRLMKNDLSSPSDEEIDHEYPYEDSKQRQITRTNKEYRARFVVTDERITSEVSRLESADSALSTRITQNANAITLEAQRRASGDSGLQSQLTVQAGQISARVTKTGGNNSSFGWTLTDSGHTWYSSNRQVMQVNSSGLSVVGKITATSGKIGGFDIGENELTYNGQPWMGTKTTGIYIGVNGIQCGNANGNHFRVTNQGELICNNITATGLKLKGTLTFYNSDGTWAGQLSASDLRKGAYEAYNGYSGWNSTENTVASNEWDWSTGSGYGFDFNNATKQSGGSYPSFFKAYSLQADDIRAFDNFYVAGRFTTGWETESWYDRDGGYHFIRYLGA